MFSLGTTTVFPATQTVFLDVLTVFSVVLEISNIYTILLCALRPILSDFTVCLSVLKLSGIHTFLLGALMKVLRALVIGATLPSADMVLVSGGSHMVLRLTPQVGRK